jgi:hypothetical protein
MFNQLLKWTLLISIWRKYKQYVGITVILALALMLTSFLHQDYVDYSLVSNNASLGLSYVIKWLVYLVLVTAYWFIVSKIKSTRGKDSDLHRMMKVAENKTAKKAQENANETLDNLSDPFANIREKKSLRSKADIEIEKAASADKNKTSNS